jgi:hypothetical protein
MDMKVRLTGENTRSLNVRVGRGSQRYCTNLKLAQVKVMLNAIITDSEGKSLPRSR